MQMMLLTSPRVYLSVQISAFAVQEDRVGDAQGFAVLEAKELAVRAPVEPVMQDQHMIGGVHLVGAMQAVLRLPHHEGPEQAVPAVHA